MESITLASTTDTIAAICTPQGRGAIAVIRLSGPQAFQIIEKCWKGKSPANFLSHTAHLGYITMPDNNEIIDQVVLTIYRAPNSFTGEDTIEIACHGSTWIQRAILNRLTDCGARLAYGGEFSQRAFLNRRIDLAQAEGIADLISSTSKAAHKIAVSQMRGKFSSRLSKLRDSLVELASLLELELDFTEEDVEFASRQKLLDISTSVYDELAKLHDSFTTGNAIKNGIPVAIIGATNAGKSSLLNALLNEEKAIVSDIHGTTRDIIEDTLEINGFLYRFMDTAGLRETHDEIERLGIDRSYNAARNARIILLVIDSTCPDTTLLSNPDIQTLFQNPDNQLIIVRNKLDLTTSSLPSINTPADTPIIDISAKTGQGLEELKRTISLLTTDSIESDATIITNVRHAQAIGNAKKSICNAISAINADISGDFIAQDIRETIHHLSEITGEISTDTLLSSIFSSFCIGK